MWNQQWILLIHKWRATNCGNCHIIVRKIQPCFIPCHMMQHLIAVHHISNSWFLENVKEPASILKEPTIWVRVGSLTSSLDFLKLLVQVKNRFLDLLFFRGMAGQSWVHIPSAALYLPVLSLQKRATAPPHWFELWTISASTLTAFWGLSWLLSCKQHLIRCFVD